MQNEKAVKTEVEAVVPPAETKKIVREFLKPSDFARGLGVSKAYIIKEISRGNIKAVKLISGQYRIPRSEYDRYVGGLEKPKELVLPVPVAERVNSTPILQYKEPTTTAGKLAAPPEIKLKKEVVKVEEIEEEETEEEAPKPKPKKKTVIKRAKREEEEIEEETEREKDDIDELFE